MQAKVPGSGDLRHHLRGEELVRERRGIRLTGRAFAASAQRSRRTVQASPAGRRPVHASGGTRAVQPSRAGHVPAAWLRDRLAVPVHGGMNTLAGAEALHMNPGCTEFTRTPPAGRVQRNVLGQRADGALRGVIGRRGAEPSASAEDRADVDRRPVPGRGQCCRRLHSRNSRSGWSRSFVQLD